MTRILSVWMVLLALIVSTRAAAQAEAEPSGYRELVEQALAEYGAGNYEEANTLFERAHALYPNARTLRGLGMAAFELRRYDESVRVLEAALSSTERPLEGSLREETAALLARARGFVATIEVTTKPVDASVSLDGEPVAPAVGPLLVPIGKHAFEARAEGYAPTRRELRVKGGEIMRVELALERLEAAVASERTERPLRRNPWLWAGVSAAVVAAAVVGTVLATRDEETRRVATPTPNTPGGISLSSSWRVH